MNTTLNGLPVQAIRNDLSTTFLNQRWKGCRIYRCKDCGTYSPVLCHGRQLWNWFIKHECKNEINARQHS